MKKLFTFLLAFFVFSFANAELAELDLVIKNKGCRPMPMKYKLEPTENGAGRLHIPAESLSKNVEYVTVRMPHWKAKKGDAGWYLLPNSSLVRFTQDEGKIRTHFPMTMFAVKKENTCEQVIIKGLAYECTLELVVKNGEYDIFLILRGGNLGEKSYEDFIVDFHELKGNDANYSKMGRIYRQWQLAEKGVVPLKKRVKKNPVLKKSVENILVRFKHGIKPIKKDLEDQTLENEPKPHISFTFEETTKFLKAMKTAGIETADVHSVGWNKSGHDGRYPQLLPVEPLFGGEEKLRETIATAKELGYQISCHTNYTDAFKIANNWDDALIARNIYGKIVKGGIWSGGRAYKPCSKQVCALRLKEDMDIVQNLGFNGMHHIDVLTCMTPQPCFAPEHFSTRGDTVNNWKTVMKECRKRFGGFSSEASYDYAAECTDFIFYVSAYPSHLPKKNPLVSEIVPLWQIAWHGIILSNPFWDTVDATGDYKRNSDFSFIKSKQDRILKLIEFGGRPCFYWINYRKYGVAPIKEAYDLYQPLKYLQYEFIDEHRELAKDIFLTRYSDGSETVVNYTDKDFSYKSEVVKAKSYKLFKPTKK